jgi:hypothetical protein
MRRCAVRALCVRLRVCVASAGVHSHKAMVAAAGGVAGGSGDCSLPPLNARAPPPPHHHRTSLEQDNLVTGMGSTKVHAGARAACLTAPPPSKRDLESRLSGMIRSSGGAVSPFRSPVADLRLRACPGTGSKCTWCNRTHVVLLAPLPGAGVTKFAAVCPRLWRRSPRA